MCFTILHEIGGRTYRISFCFMGTDLHQQKILYQGEPQNHW